MVTGTWTLNFVEFTGPAFSPLVFVVTTPLLSITIYVTAEATSTVAA
jgi:hypothetical protein